jgi:uncharacterized glyoxalase superfamily protein PhnB
MPVVFTSLRPMLRTKDLQGTIDFYTRQLGFELVGFSSADGWASLRRDVIELMVASPNAHRPFDMPAFTGSLYFNVSDAASLWASLKDIAQVVYPLEDFDYGMREFAINDNNGYLLQFGQPLDD